VSNSILVVCLSDSHGLHRDVSVPPGDILIHAGDLTGPITDPDGLPDFDQWLGELPHHHKIVVPGNHDFAIEAHPIPHSLFKNATLLIDEELDVLGLKFWGSPVTPLYSGAFGLSSSADRKKRYRNIPVGIQVLITHGPPYGMLDHAPSEPHAGCRELLKSVLRIKPRVHIFGHIHGAHGVLPACPTTFANVALVGVTDQLTHAPVVVEFHKD
jgi:Icc-related predicted phosphoesterase